MHYRLGVHRIPVADSMGRRVRRDVEIGIQLAGRPVALNDYVFENRMENGFAWPTTDFTAMDATFALERFLLRRGLSFDPWLPPTRVPESESDRNDLDHLLGRIFATGAPVVRKRFVTWRSRISGSALTKTAGDWKAHVLLWRDADPIVEFEPPYPIGKGKVGIERSGRLVSLIDSVLDFEPEPRSKGTLYGYRESRYWDEFSDRHFGIFDWYDPSAEYPYMNDEWRPEAEPSLTQKRMWAQDKCREIGLV
jgi:hypothetical protein